MCFHGSKNFFLCFTPTGIILVGTYPYVGNTSERTHTHAVILEGFTLYALVGLFTLKFTMLHWIFPLVPSYFRLLSSVLFWTCITPQLLDDITVWFTSPFLYHTESAAYFSHKSFLSKVILCCLSANTLSMNLVIFLTAYNLDLWFINAWKVSCFEMCSLYMYSRQVC